MFRFELWTVVHSVASRTPSVLEASSVEGTVAACDHTGSAHGLWQRERRKRGTRGTFCAEIFERAYIAWPESQAFVFFYGKNLKHSGFFLKHCWALPFSKLALGCSGA